MSITTTRRATVLSNNHVTLDGRLEATNAAYTTRTARTTHITESLPSPDSPISSHTDEPSAKPKVVDADAPEEEEREDVRLPTEDIAKSCFNKKD